MALRQYSYNSNGMQFDHSKEERIQENIKRHPLFQQDTTEVQNEDTNPIDLTQPTLVEIVESKEIESQEGDKKDTTQYIPNVLTPIPKRFVENADDDQEVKRVETPYSAISKQQKTKAPQSPSKVQDHKKNLTLVERFCAEKPHKQSPQPDRPVSTTKFGNLETIVNNENKDIYENGVAIYLACDEVVTYTLFIGGLPPKFDVAALKKLFANYDASNFRVVTDPETKDCKGFGFVELYTKDATNMAIDELNGTKVENRKLQVKLSDPQSKKKVVCFLCGESHLFKDCPHKTEEMYKDKLNDLRREKKKEYTQNHTENHHTESKRVIPIRYEKQDKYIKKDNDQNYYGKRYERDSRDYRSGYDHNRSWRKDEH
ncbi:glycine-rich RNA-binding protein, putative [Entamoeba invadens IP1]|uniref:Glycine-rich RNA-binding protein, putative n=1 Tax=Entamoeba invadens IP1 TaxID=370355 RepID=A0A0A1TXD0_ENTIV|nr:glycine-rich RNA-binding protein, putative [Entamoeba invadens IP1]ELP85938.1 glycine-rich RNA-binding protein, putative [Entamoeba invadens IP1]|eukprot:XP_004185284.1 glycine-rich RNA-binding protein, putative [Entamoeba invadens IP1]